MKRSVTLGVIIVLSTCLMMINNRAKQPEGIEKYVLPVEQIVAGEAVKIVGLGEATHGNGELQTLKLDVFKALVKNNNCRLFAIEGDFGGCAKVNEYILGGEGTAEEAVAEIGFEIYRTQEMADLVEWMREYNKTAKSKNKLKFYGFDMQRYDNNKELLFTYLDKVDKELSKKYRAELTDLNDKTVYEQDQTKVANALIKVEDLMLLMKDSRATYIKKTSEKEFEFAYECARSVKENATLRGAGVNYSNTRDGYMKDKVDWILKYEGNELLFITGHNGHIEKTSSAFGYTSMGDRLAQSYGNAYYAIGTDFLESTFNAVTSSGKDAVITVKSENALTSEFKTYKGNVFFMDFNKAKANNKLKEIVDSKMAMPSIGAEFNEWQKDIKTFYTLQMVPAKAYDGIIVLKVIHPYTPLGVQENK